MNRIAPATTGSIPPMPMRIRIRIRMGTGLGLGLGVSMSMSMRVDVRDNMSRLAGRLLAGLVLAWLVFVATASVTNAANAVGPEIVIPTFTPNVVDSAGVLSRSEIDSINATLQRIREQSDIWGALYIVDSLQGESIESLADRAFNKTWSLGRKGDDNGVLLVLAIQDHRSRFEVGYDLEGILTDVTVASALSRMAPLMREGRISEAVTQAFNDLATVKSGGTIAPPAAVEDRTRDKTTNFAGGWLVWGIYTLFLWLTPSCAAWLRLHRARQLAQLEPSYQLTRDIEVNGGKMTPGWLALDSTDVKSRLGVNLALTVILGFGFFGAGTDVDVFRFLLPITALLGVLYAWLYYRFTSARYSSPEAYTDWVRRRRDDAHDLVQKGYMFETSPGYFDYTQAWYSSEEYRESQRRSSNSSSSSSSSSSSRSSSSWSSSSGGGRSGGGGASGSW